MVSTILIYWCFHYKNIIHIKQNRVRVLKLRLYFLSTLLLHVAFSVDHEIAWKLLTALDNWRNVWSNLLIEKCRWVQFCAIKLPLCWEAINLISWHIQPVPRHCVKADGVYNQRISMMLMLRWHVWVWSRPQRWICTDRIKYRVSFCHCLLLQVWYTAKCWSWLSRSGSAEQ